MAYWWLMQLMQHLCTSQNCGYPNLAPPATHCCHFAPYFSQGDLAENPKRAHHVEHLSNFCPRERPDTVGKRHLIFSARRISHLQNLCAKCGLGDVCRDGTCHSRCQKAWFDISTSADLHWNQLLFPNTCSEWRTGETDFDRLTDMCRLPLALSQNVSYTSALELELNTKTGKPPRAPTLPRATWLHLMVKTILLLQLERRSAVWRSLEFLNAVHPAGCGKALSFAMATGIGFGSNIRWIPWFPDGIPILRFAHEAYEAHRNKNNMEYIGKDRKTIIPRHVTCN